MEIHGHCDERFAALREEFERNFTERGDVGASFAATIEGGLPHRPRCLQLLPHRRNALRRRDDGQ